MTTTTASQSSRPPQARQAQSRQALFAWVERKAKGLDGQELTGTTPLLATRLLRSLQIPELILYLEELRGAPIDVTRLQAGDFADIDTICDRFLSDEEARR